MSHIRCRRSVECMTAARTRHAGWRWLLFLNPELRSDSSKTGHFIRNSIIPIDVLRKLTVLSAALALLALRTCCSVNVEVFGHLRRFALLWLVMIEKMKTLEGASTAIYTNKIDQIFVAMSHFNRGRITIMMRLKGANHEDSVLSLVALISEGQHHSRLTMVRPGICANSPRLQIHFRLKPSEEQAVWTRTVAATTHTRNHVSAFGLQVPVHGKSKK